MPSPGSRFTYEALALGEFRLLSIRPGHAPCEYNCSLRHENISNPPPYKALSYAWGDPTANHGIKVNDGVFLINSNLKTALKHLDFEDQEAIWIDAICINQNDDQEKSSQIAAMSHIYRGASEVIAWIGESSWESRRAFAFLSAWLDSVVELQIHQGPVDEGDLYDLNQRKDLIVSEFPSLKGDVVHQILKIIQDDMSMSLGCLNSPHISSIEIDIHVLSQPAENRILDLIREYVISRDDAETSEDEEAPHKVKLSNPRGPLAKFLGSIDGNFHALRNMFSERAWWERLWVIQEAVVSRELSLQCGQEKIPWEGVLELWRSPGISDQRYLNGSASYILEGNEFRHVRRLTTDGSSLGKEEFDTTMSMSVAAAEGINARSESDNSKALMQERGESDQETVASEDYGNSPENCIPFTRDEFLGEDGPFGINYRDSLRHSTLGYMFFTTKTGYMGLVQGNASPGDLVAIVQGSDIPLILRRQVSGPGTDGNETIFHTLVGASYVHGIMDGQARAAAELCGLEKDKIYIK
ncbi:unnamed protein product [Clonostachys rhizophaga]|uniref:Heterokaryon incompatibility domain-containing protein n=1 Tax=Clonostachys rhizophaga TaxID=160324 RepID=A0A9N9W1L8_9HYPO|nr:unnamed protein product [Clonostachys rhizophaga]